MRRADGSSVIEKDGQRAWWKRTAAAQEGALAFLDECLLEPNAHVVIIGATAAPEKACWCGAPRVSRCCGTPVSVSDASRSSMAPPSRRRRETTGNPWTTTRWTFEDHTAVHDEAWEAARRGQMAMAQG